MNAAPGLIELIPFVPDRDLSRMAAWLRQPHVMSWWGDPDKALREVEQRPHGGGDALISVDGVPAGYVRWQLPSREELNAAGLDDVPDDAVDIDIMIGEPDQIGRGIGSRALAILRDRLAEGGVRMIILCTSVDNVQAITAYEKAGFARRRRFADPECGPCWLMTFEPRPG